MELDATFWAFVSLLIVFAIAIYLKVPGMIAKSLDARIARIELDLAEARKLREDAQALLDEYEAKRKAAEGEAEAIVAAAHEEAERLTVEQAVACYTAGSAWAGFEEAEKGRLQPGYAADFVVLSSDPARVPVDRIRDIRVLQTYVDGRRAFDATG